MQTVVLISLVALGITICAHAAASIWWAASLTGRVEHIEKWVEHNNSVSERLAVIEAELKQISRALRCGAAEGGDL